MSNAVLKGNASGTGTVTLETPNTNSDRTISFPDATGTVMVSGNMPAFSVNLSSNQSVSVTTYTKIAFNSKTFDTSSDFDNTTNYRFTPQVAGYYQVNTEAAINGSPTGMYLLFYKNGSVNSRTYFGTGQACFSNLIYLNGTTDYLEVYVYVYGSPTTINGNPVETFFSGALVRGA